MKTNEMDKLMTLRPCEEAVKWARGYPTLQAAWDACPRGDWLLWWMGRTCGPVGSESHRQMTAAKCACARLVLHLFESAQPQDRRPRAAIELAEKYALGAAYDVAAACDAYAATAAAAGNAGNAAYAAASAASATASACDAAAAAAAAAYATVAAYAATSAAAAYAAALATAAAAGNAGNAAYVANVATATAAYTAAFEAARSEMLVRCAEAVRGVCPRIPL